MKVVIAYDGSDSSKKAVLFTRSLLKSEDEVYIVTVIKEAPRTPEQKIINDVSEAEKKQVEILRELEGYRVTKEVLEAQDVAVALIEYCKKVNCNMIVTGSRGLTGLKKAILGSVSSELISKSHVPVLVVK